MKNKLILYLFCYLLFNSCSQNKQELNKNGQYNINTEDTFAMKKSCFPSNDSFQYNIVLTTYPTEGLRAIKKFEINVDSLYINCFNKLSTQDIVGLLKSENTDFATYVLLYKLYKDVVPGNLINFTNIEDWRKEINKEKMIVNWESSLKKLR